MNPMRIATHLTDAEWGLVASLIPPARRGGRPCDVEVRELLNAVFYLVSVSCKWDALPKDLPPKNTVYDHFSLCRSNRTLLQLQQGMYVRVREAAGRADEPMWRSSTAKERKSPVVKRHIVHTPSLLLNVVVHRASLPNRDGIRWLLRHAQRRFALIIKSFGECRIPRATRRPGRR